MSVNEPLRSTSEESRQRLYTLGCLEGEMSCVGNLEEVDKSARGRGDVFLRLFDLASRLGRPADWQLFFDRWQEGLAAAPRQRPLLRNLTPTHHLIADTLQSAPRIGDRYLRIDLPCSNCGCVFESCWSGHAYPRACGKCRERRGAGLCEEPHPRSVGVFARAGLGYACWLPGSEGPLERVVEYIGCAESGCPAWFSTDRRDQDYCPIHSTGAAREKRRRRNRRVTGTSVS